MYKLIYNLEVTDKEKVLEKVLKEIREYMESYIVAENFQHKFDIILNEEYNCPFVMTFTLDYYVFEDSQDAYIKDINFWIDGDNCVIDESYKEELEEEIIKKI